MRIFAFSSMLAISVAAASPAWSQSAAPPIDPAWKLPEIMAFIGLKKGDRVADIVGGRLTAALAQAVGPSGKVYAVETAEIVKIHPEVLDMMDSLAAQSPNVIRETGRIASPRAWR